MINKQHDKHDDEKKRNKNDDYNTERILEKTQ